MFSKQNLIYSYSRKQAIEDGVLVDVSEMAKESGFNYPVAMTSAVHSDIKNIPASQNHQSYDGRLWDILNVLRWRIKAGKADGNILHFTLIMHTPGKELYKLKSVCGPGDDMEPVLTIMLPEED